MVGLDRRRSDRVPLHDGAADGFTERRSDKFRVVNLSHGGTLIQGEETPSMGEAVRLVLRLPEGTGLPLRGWVVRQERLLPGADRVAVEFEALGPEVEAQLSELLARGIERLRQAGVLVGHSSHREGEGLVRCLAALGVRARHVTTPLAAIQALEDAGAPVRAALLGMRLGAVSGVEFLRFLAMHYPAVRRVLLVTRGFQPSAGCRPVLDAVLDQRFTTQELERACGVR